MKKLYQNTMILFFLTFIFIIPILTFRQPKAKTSTIENRSLATPPIYSKELLLNGAYFGQWEKYLSDHLIGRDDWIENHALLNLNILGKRKVNNIVIGKEDTLLPYYTKKMGAVYETNLSNLPMMIQNLDKLNQHIQQHGGQFCFIGIPEQSSFFRSRYPDAFFNNETYFIENETTLFQGLTEKDIPYLNMNALFDNEAKYYLKTDHHFSFEGAYATYASIITKLKSELGLSISDPLSLDEMELTTLEPPLLGSRNRQIYYLYPTEDRITISYPKEAIPYEKWTNGVADQRLYFFSEDPKVRPTYSIYMGGDKAEILIDTHRPHLPNLLLFGDSYTNAVEPLLYYHFNQVRILDLRHYKENSLYEYINLHQPHVVLMIRDDLNYGNLEGNGDF